MPFVVPSPLGLSELPPFTVLRHAGELEPQELAALEDPLAVLRHPRTRILKLGLAGRIVGHVRREGRQRIVKLFDESPLRYRLVRLFTGSAAARSGAGTELMRAAGLRAPAVLALLQTSFWRVRIASCIVSEYIEGARGDLLWAGLRGRSRARFVVSLAAAMRRIHAAGVYPQDVGMWNWIIAPEALEVPCLVDLDRVRRYRNLSWRRRVKNLTQLERSFGRSASAAEKLLFLRRYLGRRNGPELPALAQRVRSATEAKDRSKRRAYSRRRKSVSDLV